VAPPLVPELLLHLADPGDPHEGLFPVWERSGRLPYWAFAWPGGQAVARHVLDRPGLVAGRRVLDVGTGGGVVAVAAALAGAAAVTAVDVDPEALGRAAANAAANGVRITTRQGDVLDDALLGDPLLEDFPLGDPVDVVLVGDLLYDAGTAPRVVALVQAWAADGRLVLVGEPERAHRRPVRPGGPPAEADRRRWTAQARYDVPDPGGLESGPVAAVTVWRVTAAGP
jgi:predicted nicotinamide N-methyase